VGKGKINQRGKKNGSSSKKEEIMSNIEQPFSGNEISEAIGYLGDFGKESLSESWVERIAAMLDSYRDSQAIPLTESELLAAFRVNLPDLTKMVKLLDRGVIGAWSFNEWVRKNGYQYGQ